MSSSPVRSGSHTFASRDKCYLRCDNTVKPARPETSPTHSHANCCAAEPYTSLRIAPSVRRYAAYSQHRRVTGLAGKRRCQWRPAARYDLQAMGTPRSATKRRQAAQTSYEAAQRCAVTTATRVWTCPRGACTYPRRPGRGAPHASHMGALRRVVGREQQAGQFRAYHLRLLLVYNNGRGASAEPY